MPKLPPFSGISSDPGNRRAAHRYLAQAVPALIGWRVDDQVRTARVSLMDISMGGARARGDCAPPPGAVVLIRLASRERLDPIRATVVGVAGPRKSSLFRRGVPGYLIRLSFGDGCPYEVFKAAVDGFVVETEAATFECEGFDPRYWR